MDKYTLAKDVYQSNELFYLDVETDIFSKNPKIWNKDIRKAKVFLSEPIELAKKYGAVVVKLD